MNKTWMTAVAALTAFSVSAQEMVSYEFEAPGVSKTEKVADHPDGTVTIHQARIGEEDVFYYAFAETMTLADDDGKATAEVFHTAYRRFYPEAWQPPATSLEEVRQRTSRPGRRLSPSDGRKTGTNKSADLVGDGDRPITFVFNGGPGSSSIWLHMGLFGPKRIEPVDDFGNPGPPPYNAIDNVYSMLDKTDLVFIDPVSTGYSRAVEGVDAQQFHGVEGDLDSIAEFIRQFLGQHELWDRPIFIAGESYGTFRAAGLAAALWNDHHIATSGIVLISAVLDFLTIRFVDGHDMPYALFLPTYTATGHHHGQLAPRYQRMSMEDALAEAERFAMTEYSLALLKGSAIDDDEMNAVAQKMADLTGLSKEFVIRSNLRVSQSRFGKELLRDQGETVGRFDSRFKGRDIDDAGENYEYDASYAAIRGIFTHTFNQYVREELGYETDLDYRVLTGAVRPWIYGEDGSMSITTTAERLRSAMHQQPYMKVLLCSGYFDVATPYFAADYVMDRMLARPEIRENMTTEYYNAGHMMYLNKPDLEKMRGDLVEFYESVPGRD